MTNHSTQKEWEEAVWRKVLKELSDDDQSSIEKIDQLLVVLLTPQEKQQIIKRAATIFFLKKGMSYREISRTVQLSQQTISSINKSIKSRMGYLSYLSPKKKKEKSKKINIVLTDADRRRIKIDTLLSLVTDFPRPPSLYRHTLLEKKLGLRKHL